MESFLPLFSQVEEDQPPPLETRLEPRSQPMTAEPITKGPSLPTSDDGWDFEPEQPYSPTKTELESHPIRQRLSIQGDDITTGLKSAPTIPSEFNSCASPAAKELAQEADRKTSDAMADTSIKEGDSASYAWGGDKKGGTVTEVAKEGPVTMETKSGNTVSKEGTHKDPAIRLERAGHDVVKNASEVQKESAGETHNEGGVQKTVPEKSAESHAGEKRAAEPKENGEEPKKKKGRPAKGVVGGIKKETKKRAPKKAATESGEPRRSGRVASKSS